MNDWLIFIGFNRTKTDSAKYLIRRFRGEGEFMCEVAVADAHSVKAFGIGDVDEADTTGNEHAKNRVQQVEEFLPR